MAAALAGPAGASETAWRAKDRMANKDGSRRTAFFVAPKSRKTANPTRISAAGPDGPIDSFKMTGSYQGEWRNNAKEGFGTQTNADGSKYEGEWVANKKHGRGTQWVKKGSELQKRYAGDWYAGKRHGFGVFFFDNGDRFEGEFVEGKRNGQGTMVYADGSVYEGHWESGQRSGVGVLTTASGDAYEGHWQEDVKHGPGRLFYRRTRKMYEGEWVDGAPKCGVFSSIPDASGAASAADDDDFVLPELALRDPDAVIMEAVAAARAAAAEARGEAPIEGVPEAGAEAGTTEGVAEPAEAGDAGPWPAESLSEEELEELWTAFVSAPAGVTESRSIAAGDLGSVLEVLGLMPTDDDIARILRLAGVDHDAELPFDAFAAVMASLRQ